MLLWGSGAAFKFRLSPLGLACAVLPPHPVGPGLFLLSGLPSLALELPSPRRPIAAGCSAHVGAVQCLLRRGGTALQLPHCRLGSWLPPLAGQPACAASGDATGGKNP